MVVNKNELVRQMQVVVHNLDGTAGTQDLAEIIKGWVLCVEALHEDEPTEYQETDTAIIGAVNDAKAHQPFKP